MIENKKRYFMIVGVLCIISALIGGTLAWYTWQSENNTNVSFTVGGVNVTFNAGSDITSSKLRPVSTKEYGVTNDYAIEKTITASSPVTAYLNLYLTLETLPTGLKHESFIWEIYKDNALVSKGNFKNNNQGDRVTIASNQEITSTTSTYKLYIWIDGANYSNPETMQNQTFKFVLSADATDQEPPALITLTKLGLTVSEGAPDFNKSAQSSCSDESTCETTNGIYAAEDDLGTSYYFRGAVENNYVKFANFYWRIIRINGDGTIRMIYDGTSAHANGESSTDRQVGTTAYNTNSNDNAYVGYMYGTPGSSTYEDTHANTNDSTIKTANDNWYKTNIADAGYSQYIADAIYCADRQVASVPSMGLSGNGTGTQATGYGLFNRVEFSPEGMPTNVTPSLKCPQANDKFTVTSSLGNGDLTYPVGLLTVDEGLFSGGTLMNENTYYYLFSGQYYWTMSPGIFNSSDSLVWYVASTGFLSSHSVNDSHALRPVISLKSDIIFSGNGSMSQPFEIVS